MERWVCPFCNMSQVIGEQSKQEFRVAITLAGVRPSEPSLSATAYGCTNPECRYLSLSVAVHAITHEQGPARRRLLLTQPLLPKSRSKPQPDYIPLALREDYDEACSIRDLSPKAAATLVRRCLQGMIRDFCGITDKRRLVDEVRALQGLVVEGKAPSGVTQESVEAIDQVRGIGNIGAHMEKDIDLIVDVDPDEATVLIELVEMLFDEWYVARHQRQVRLDRIRNISKIKEDAKKGALPAADSEGTP